MKSYNSKREVMQKMIWNQPFLKFIFSFRCLAAHWLFQLAKCVWIGQVKIFTLIICKDPGKDWVLRKIAITTSCQGIEMHKVLEIAYFSIFPPFSKGLVHYFKKTATLIAFLF